MFPTLIPEPSGRHAIALLHRPLFPGTRPEEKLCKAGSEPIDIDRESIWISYCHSVSKGDEDHHLEFVAHHRLACPVEEWERLKIGGGAPPVFCRDGWLMLYHGVHDIPQMNTGETALCYSAGAMVLSKENPNKIIYRSPHPVLVPKGLLEREGVVANVVFRSGIDRRDDLGAPERFDVYYGMADYRIGVARLDVPATLPGAQPPSAIPLIMANLVSPPSPDRIPGVVVAGASVSRRAGSPERAGARHIRVTL